VTIKKKWIVSDPNIPSEFAPCLMAKDYLFLNHQKKFSGYCAGDDNNDKHQLHLHSKEQQPSASRDPEFCPCLDSSEPQNITEIELNDLIRNLELPKNKAEFLASRLQQ
jgi:hypothetical protein